MTIPKDVVYAAANEFISRYRGTTSIEVEFAVSVKNANGETATGDNRMHSNELAVCLCVLMLLRSNAFTRAVAINCRDIYI